MSLDTDNWELLQTLFHLAEGAAPEDRERVLKERCANPELVRRAMEIIDGTEKLEREAKPAEEQSRPSRIGPYSLLRMLGSGGLGTVYLAERIAGGVPQRSALKILAPYAAGPSFVERFHREQHILASLDHAHITRMLDAGIGADGMPYLVMEYVEGDHLDAYCDAKRLKIEDRIRLFLQVCDAVAYAHRNLIVHLDLKPSNILVDREGEVKLLDFGTSKLIGADMQLTTTVLATPAYASPEQLRNEAVTTACDVYSLGVILRELLAGRATTQTASVLFERALHEQELEALPTVIAAGAGEARGVSDAKLRQLLAGDLATITAKCTRARAVDRYASVDALSEDLNRYLNGMAVLARPQTALYRIGKFVRRNRKLVAVAACAAVLLAGAIGYAELKQRRAIEEGRRAERMQALMRSLFRIANSENLGKPTMSVNDFLNLGVRTLPLYVHDEADLRAAQMGLAESLHDNSDYADAQKVFLEIAAKSRAAGDSNAEAEALAYAGDIAFHDGKVESGMQLTQRALDLSRNSKVTPAVRVTAERFYGMNRERFELHSDANIQLLKQAVSEAKSSGLPPSEIAAVLQGLGGAMQSMLQMDQAESYYRQALAYYAQDAAYLYNGAILEGELGHLEQLDGKFEEALAHHRQALEAIIRCTGDGSPDAQYERKYVAQDLLWLNRPAEALAIMQPTVAADRKLDNGAGGPQLANALYVLASAYVATGHAQEGEKLVKEEMDMAAGKLSPSSRGFAWMYLLYAQALAAEHRDRDALPYAERAWQALGQVKAGDTVTDRKRSAEAQEVLAAVRARLAGSGDGEKPAASGRRS